MKEFDFLTFNVNVIVAFYLKLIAAALVYIAFKLSEKKPHKSSK